MIAKIYLDPSPEQAEAIAGNVRLVTKAFTDLTGEHLPPGQAGVTFLEGFIERQRQRGDEALLAQLVDMAGCYLGEALVVEAGARWVQDPEYGLGVELASDSVAFPFAKVTKQFEKGVEGGESVVSLFDISVKLATDAQFRASMSKTEPLIPDP